MTGILVSLISRRTSDDKLNYFFKLIRTPVRAGEVIPAPCTLPVDHLPTEEGKLLPFADLEIPTPSKVGMIGFGLAWYMVGIIIWLTTFLAGLR